MARTGIMGGTFDPIHLAHLLIAQSAKEQLELDRVLFLTSGNPPHKTGRVVTDKIVRNEMVASAISGNPSFSLCDYEVDKKEYSYTSETLKYLKEKKPDDEFYLIIGEDSLAYLEKWHDPKTIVELSVPCVYRRGENSNIDYEVKRIKELLNTEVLVIDAPIIDISSTKIRKLCSLGKSVRYMVPDSVIEIIERERLYVLND